MVQTYAVFFNSDYNVWHITFYSSDTNLTKTTNKSKLSALFSENENKFSNNQIEKAWVCLEIWVRGMFVIYTNKYTRREPTTYNYSILSVIDKVMVILLCEINTV